VAFIVDLVAHMDAGDREQWPGDQDERPLTDLGRQQARALADAMSSAPIAALYAGTALRCRQTLEPLAERLGLPVNVCPELGEKQAWRLPDGWGPGPGDAAHAAGMALRGIDKLRTLHPNEAVVACSHGHVIPALVAYLVAVHGLHDVAQLTFAIARHAARRGQWYRLRFDGERVDIELHEAPGFPN
jgi:8-oxo-dGTP diphosphatase